MPSHTVISSLTSKGYCLFFVSSEIEFVLFMIIDAFSVMVDYLTSFAMLFTLLLSLCIASFYSLLLKHFHCGDGSTLYIDGMVEVLYIFVNIMLLVVQPLIRTMVTIVNKEVQYSIQWWRGKRLYLSINFFRFLV